MITVIAAIIKNDNKIVDDKKEDIKEERGSCDELVFESIGDHSIRISIDLEGTIRIYTSDPSVSFLVDRRDLSTKTITLRKNLTNPTQ